MLKNAYNLFSRYLVLWYLKVALGFLAMMGISVLVFFVTSSEVAVEIWAIVLFFGSLFVATSYMFYSEKPEVEMVCDEEDPLFVAGEMQAPMTLRESAIEGFRLTWQVFLLIASSAILYSLFF